MHSDNGFERLVKLWISIWSLVLERKRHLETVTALLQRIVFEERGYPRFKNWGAICKLGKTDHLMMMAVATIDLSCKDARIQQFIAAFPECFSYEETHGPYPLSLILTEAKERDFFQEAIPEWMPVQPFKLDAVKDLDFPVLPAQIDPHAGQGDVVVWGRKSFVVLYSDNDEIWIAPTECIDIDV